jgi:hypothetical protein
MNEIRIVSAHLTRNQILIVVLRAGLASHYLIGDFFRAVVNELADIDAGIIHTDACVDDICRRRLDMLPLPACRARKTKPRKRVVLGEPCARPMRRRTP